MTQSKVSAMVLSGHGHRLRAGDFITLAVDGVHCTLRVISADERELDTHLTVSRCGPKPRANVRRGKGERKRNRAERWR